MNEPVEEKMASFEDLLNDVSQSMADIVSALESRVGNDERVAEIIAAALGKLKLPQATVTVTPAPVVVQAAPKSNAVFRIVFESDLRGNTTGMTITRTEKD